MSISLEFATTFPCSLPPRTVSRRGSKPDRLLRNKASASRCIHFEFMTLPRLGLVDLFHAGRTNCFFCSYSAIGCPFHDRFRPVVFSCHCLFLQHADGTLAPCLRPDPPLSCGASLPHASGLARLRLVRDDFRVSNLHLRHSPAPYLQRKALLDSRNALRRDSLWALRESP